MKSAVTGATGALSAGGSLGVVGVLSAGGSLGVVGVLSAGGSLGVVGVLSAGGSLGVVDVLSGVLSAGGSLGVVDVLSAGGSLGVVDALSAGVVAGGVEELDSGGDAVSDGAGVVCADAGSGDDVVGDVGDVVLVELGASGDAVVAKDAAAGSLGAGMKLVGPTAPAAVDPPSSVGSAGSAVWDGGADAVVWAAGWLTTGLCVAPEPSSWLPT